MTHPDIWLFEPALDRAKNRWTDAEVHFTRAERALLGVFFSHPGAILARDRLLDAMSGLDTDATDRSVDFIVHGLRKKLGDSPRDPLYIATRYGEGYMWIGPREPTRPPCAGAFIVIGPLHGLKFTQGLDDRGLLFAKALAREIDRQTPAERRVILDANCPGPERFRGELPRFAVDLNFIQTSTEQLDCVARARSFDSPVPILEQRIRLMEETGPAAASRTHVNGLATAVTNAIWAALQMGGPGPASSTLGPLPVGLQAASEIMANGCDAWEDAIRRLRQYLSRNPHDHEARISLATALHSQYVLAGTELLMVADDRASNDAEIERLVLQALPHLRIDGRHIFTAAKLLYFANKNHRERALSIAARAFDTTAALAVGFTIQAQLQMWEGHLAQALQFYDQALELCDHGTSFHIYLLVLKSQAAMACDPSGTAVADALYTVKPATRTELGLLLAPTAGIDLTTEIHAILAAMTPARARATLQFVHYVTARHFQCPAHRRNIMRRPAEFLVERFGADIVPPDVRGDDVPLADCPDLSPD